MGTINLPNFRTTADVTMNTRLKDGGIYIDWAGLTDIRAWIYSDAQKAMAGRADVTIDQEDSTKAVLVYAGTKAQYPGINRLIIQARYNGSLKTYDRPVFNFVARTAEATGNVTIDDPETDVEIEVTDVSSSILDAAIAAAVAAAVRAEEAAEAAEHMVDIHQGPPGEDGKSPYIGENGHWYEWDEDAGEYVDTETEAQGETGTTPDITIGTVTTAEPGTPAAATMTGTPEAPVLNLTIPKGVAGDTPAFTVGEVTTGQPGTPVVVTITGTAAAPVLNVQIPQGLQGNPGSSVDYPFELVNNATTNDATKAATAAVAKGLKDDITQLEAEVDDIEDGLVVADILTLPLTATRGLRPMSNGTVSNAYNGYSYIAEVKYGHLYHINAVVPTGTGNYLRLGFTQDYPANGVAVTGYIDYSTGEHDVAYVAPFNGYLLMECINDFTSISVKTENGDTTGKTIKNLLDCKEAVVDETGINLFDKSGLINGYINSSTGVITDKNGLITASAMSDIIPVKPGYYYYLSGRSEVSGALQTIRCFGADGTIMKVLVASSGNAYSTYALSVDGVNVAYNGQFKVPANAYFVQFSIRGSSIGNPDTIMLNEIGDTYISAYTPPAYQPYGKTYKIKLSALPTSLSLFTMFAGKKVAIFGGSVSWLPKYWGIYNTLADILGATIDCFSKSGGGYARDTTIVGGQPVFDSKSIPYQVNDETEVGDTKYDVYVLWSSTNDTACDVGDATDYTYFDSYDVNKLTTQNGGMNYCIKKIHDFNPEAHIIVIGSLKSFDGGAGGASLTSKLKQLVDGQEQVALLQSCPFYSLWANGGVDCYNKDTFFTWTIENEGTNQSDGVHPNKWAYTNVILPKLAKQIALLY